MRTVSLTLLFLLSAASGCSKDVAQTVACKPGGVSISDAWVRAARESQPSSAAYFTLCNGGDDDDALLGVSFSGASAVEIHSTSVNADGVASMTRLEAFDLPTGEAASLSPGGAHVMLLGLERALTPGATVEMQLTFKNAPAQTVTVEVHDSPPDAHH